MTEVKLLIAVFIGIAIGQIAVKIYIKHLERISGGTHEDRKH